MRIEQAAHWIYAVENVTQQFLTTIAIVLLVLIVAVETRSMHENGHYAHPIVLVAIMPVLVMVVAPSYTVETSFISASKSFFGIFIYSSLVADCVESLVRENSNEFGSKSTKQKLHVPGSLIRQ